MILKLWHDGEGWGAAVYEDDDNHRGIPRYAAWRHFSDPVRALAFALYHFARGSRRLRHLDKEDA